jgi:hypothetical protein
MRTSCISNNSHSIPEKVIEYDVDNAQIYSDYKLPLVTMVVPLNLSGVYNPDGSLTVTYNGVKGWYGSYSKITIIKVLPKDSITN